MPIRELSREAALAKAIRAAVKTARAAKTLPVPDDVKIAVRVRDGGVDAIVDAPRAWHLEEWTDTSLGFERSMSRTSAAGRALGDALVALFKENRSSTEQGYIWCRVMTTAGTSLGSLPAASWVPGQD